MALKDLIETTKRELVNRAQQFYDVKQAVILNIFDEPDLIQSRFTDPYLRNIFNDYAHLYKNLNKLEGAIIPTTAIEDAEIIKQINQFLIYEGQTESQEIKKLNVVISTYIDLYKDQKTDDEQRERDRRIKEVSDQITYTQESEQERAEREQIRPFDEKNQQE